MVPAVRRNYTDWRVQVRDQNGFWRDKVKATRAGPAIRAWQALSYPEKRLVRNGRPLRMRVTSEQLDIFREDDDTNTAEETA